MSKNNFLDTIIQSSKKISIKYFCKTKNKRGDSPLQH